MKGITNATNQFLFSLRTKYLFLNIIFLEISKSNRIVPKGLYVKKDFFSAEIFVKGILLYLAKGKVRLSVAIMRFIDPRK